jgi:uncharacterized protein
MFKHGTLKQTCLLALSVATLYAALSPAVAWPLYSSILFRPDRHINDISIKTQEIALKFSAKKEDVVFKTKNGKVLHGLFFELPGTQRVFLVSEGKGGNIYRKINVAAALLNCGGSVLMYDYEGYGLSEGTPTLDGVCDDVTAAYDYLIQHEHRKDKEIIAFGESFGSGVTGQLLKRRQPGAVIMQSGFASLVQAARDYLPWLKLYPDGSFPKQSLDNMAIFKKPHPPLLIVHGTADRVVLFHNAQDLYNSASEPKSIMVVQGGGHGCFGKDEEFKSKVTAFLAQNSI